MQAFNSTCLQKARRLKLPSSERLSYILHNLGSGAYATKVDIPVCYWSVLSPETLQQAIHIGAGSYTYAILRVMFGWHQAPGLVQHLIATLLQHVDKEAVIVIQYLADILCVSHYRVYFGEPREAEGPFMYSIGALRNRADQRSITCLLLLHQT